MTKKSQYISILILLGITLSMWGLLNPAVGQAILTQQQQPPIKPPQFKPVSLEHLYWHFLALQNFLDKKAAEQESLGKDGSRLRNQLQKRAGLSNADYAPFRTSSVRLTAKVKDLDAQAAKIQKAGSSSSSHDHLKALTAQREASINSEISYLKQNLPSDKKKTFEAFLTRFFSPNNAVSRPSSFTGKPAVTGQPAPAAVQQ